MNKSNVFSLAWDVKRNSDVTISVALKKSWNFNKKRTLARTSNVEVSFEKKDGSMRTAIVTTNMNTIPTEKRPSERYPFKLGMVRVFDIQKGDWIQFNVNNLR